MKKKKKIDKVEITYENLLINYNIFKRKKSHLNYLIKTQKRLKKKLYVVFKIKKNNFFINLLTSNGKLIKTISTGLIGLQGPAKTTPYAISNVTKEFSKYLFYNKIKKIYFIRSLKKKKKVKNIKYLLKYYNKDLNVKHLKYIKFCHSKGLKKKKVRRV